jgi:hypothetical protein
MSDVTVLYRFYGGDGRLLYIGITGSVMTRLSQHRATKTWFRLVTSATFEHFDTREAAAAAEIRAIVDECPERNIDEVKQKKLIPCSECGRVVRMRSDGAPWRHSGPYVLDKVTGRQTRRCGGPGLTTQEQP